MSALLKSAMLQSTLLQSTLLQKTGTEHFCPPISWNILNRYTHRCALFNVLCGLLVDSWLKLRRGPLLVRGL